MAAPGMMLATLLCEQSIPPRNRALVNMGCRVWTFSLAKGRQPCNGASGSTLVAPVCSAQAAQSVRQAGQAACVPEAARAHEGLGRW
jgi:hypothetical protein